MQNAGIETALVDDEVAQLLKKMLQKIQSALQQCLTDALQDGSLSTVHLPSTDMTQLARFLLIQAQGLIVFRRATESDEDLALQVRCILAQIDLWSSGQTSPQDSPSPVW